MHQPHQSEPVKLTSTNFPSAFACACAMEKSLSHVAAPRTSFDSETKVTTVKTRYILANFMEDQRGAEDGGDAGCAACRAGSTASNASTRCTRGRLVRTAVGNRGAVAVDADGELVEPTEVPVDGCDVD